MGICEGRAPEGEQEQRDVHAAEAARLARVKLAGRGLVGLAAAHPRRCRLAVGVVVAAVARMVAGYGRFGSLGFEAGRSGE